MERRKTMDMMDIVYDIHFLNQRKYLVKFYVANAISSVPKSGRWFKAECTEKHGKRDWVVFLCYDKDAYKNEISQFYEDDWKVLRSRLGSAQRVTDLAATADIEDVLLADLRGVCNHLGCPVVTAESLRGRKGSAKMKALFRNHGQAYHKGERAKALIDCLLGYAENR